MLCSFTSHTWPSTTSSYHSPLHACTKLCQRTRLDQLLGHALILNGRQPDWDNYHPRLMKTTLETHAAARLNNPKRTRFRSGCPTASEGTLQAQKHCAKSKLSRHRDGLSQRPTKRSHSRRQSVRTFQMARAFTQRHLLWVFCRTSTPPLPLRSDAGPALCVGPIATEPTDTAH